MKGLIVTTEGGDILGVVLNETKHEKLIRRDIDDLIQEWTGGVDSIEYSPEEIEYVTTNKDGEKSVFYVDDVKIR